MNGFAKVIVAAGIGPLLLSATSAGAQEACVVPAELKGFAHPAAVKLGAMLVPGRAVRTTLRRDPRWPTPPEKTAEAGRYGGALALTIVSTGRYRVAVDGPIWIDVVRDGQRLASAEHGHAPPCSGARKLVAYDLTPGRYVVQLSNAVAASATVMVVPGAVAE